LSVTIAIAHTHAADGDVYDDADIFTIVHGDRRRVGNLLVGLHSATTMTPLALVTTRDRRTDGGHAKCICEAYPKARQSTIYV